MKTPLQISLAGRQNHLWWRHKYIILIDVNMAGIKLSGGPQNMKDKS